MKKNTLLFALLFCAALIVPGVLKAQPAGKVIITNMTGCELHLVAVGSLSTCGVSASYTSTMINTTGTVVFDVSAGIPGWSSGPALISGIYLYPAGTCGFPSPLFFPYGACPGFATSLLAYSVSNGDCVRCSRSQFNGVYTPPPFPGGTATLVFS
ncbi:hypothetical protein [Taibaiella helva]|uniref:hypothetical protein n=1 Tax=Taibaiella helva TaxID=2301235 RepID=UPI000E58AB32|nr:hypothetical protein [Taibaiella helva]